jgi:hypothetical protein
MTVEASGDGSDPQRDGFLRPMTFALVALVIGGLVSAFAVRRVRARRERSIDVSTRQRKKMAHRSPRWPRCALRG